MRPIPRPELGDRFRKVGHRGALRQTEPARVTVTFKEAGDRWLARGKARGWRASTANDYESCLRRLNREFAWVKIAQLNEQRIEDWLRKLRREVGARTVQKLLFVGRHAIDDFLDHGDGGFAAELFDDVLVGFGDDERMADGTAALGDDGLDVDCAVKR